jgi:predicted ATPase
MVAWAIAGAQVQPLVLVFEDLQWFDPTSIDAVRALSDRGAQAPLLILATARPEFRSPWSLRPHHSVISLTPLDDAQVQRLVAELAYQRTLSTEVIKGVSERAGGVPLFVEEVTRLLLERSEQGGAKAIPPTLRQSLAARLDAALDRLSRETAIVHHITEDEAVREIESILIARPLFAK